MDVYTQLFHFALALLSIGITSLAPTIYKWLTARVESLQQGISAQNMWLFTTFVETVVKAAEQNGLNGLLPDDAAKKAWAIKQIQDWVDARGLSINVAEIEATIEAAIKDGIHKGDQPMISVQGLAPKSDSVATPS